MITEEERERLKVGDAVYFVHDNDDGYPDYSSLTLEYFGKDIVTLDSENFFIQDSRLFLNLNNAIERIIEMQDEKIKNLIKDKKYYMKQMEQENGN